LFNITSFELLVGMALMLSSLPANVDRLVQAGATASVAGAAACCVSAMLHWPGMRFSGALPAFILQFGSLCLPYSSGFYERLVGPCVWQRMAGICQVHSCHLTRLWLRFVYQLLYM
jgi:hypothetical protein